MSGRVRSVALAACLALASSTATTLARAADGAAVAAAAEETGTAVGEVAADAPARVIRVGVREDARPFSYRGHTDASERVLAGYRGYMIEICRRVLREVVSDGPFEGYEVEGVLIEAMGRFEALGDGAGDEGDEVDMLCGPDSITPARLRAHNVSQPMFVSGMTYAYVDPKSDLFSRGPRCGNVVGVLRGTTAADMGLRRLADENVLMRFDEALEGYLAKSPARVRDVERIIARANRRRDERLDASTSLDEREQVEAARQKEIDVGIGKARGDLAESLRTEECPDGFDGLPVRSYRSHDEGIPALCRGEVLYYVGDYDIIVRKVRAIRDCPVIVERFTRTKEVYAAFFRAGHLAASLGPDTGRAERCETCVRDTLLYAAFNHALLGMMQPQVDILAFEFEREFGEQAKSVDLEAFFEGFRIVSDY